MLAPAPPPPGAGTGDFAGPEHVQAERANMRHGTAPAPAGAPRAAATGATPPAVYRATVSVHSECERSVRLFRGATSGRGRYAAGGTYGWHSPNTIATYHLSGDDELCIVDENDRDVVACTQPPDGAQLRVTPSCGGFSRR